MLTSLTFRSIVTAKLIHPNKGILVHLFSSSSFSSGRHDYSHNNFQDQENSQNLSSTQPSDTRLLKVAIIGVPNAGKSTLINRILSYDVCPVSKKAHTTRGNQQAIFLEENTQIVFMDTPGVVSKKETKKFSFPEDFVNSPQNSVRDADLIAVIHSIENKILKNKLDPKVIGVLQKFPTKNSILIINKIDKISGKRKLLETVNYLSEGVIGGKPVPIIPKKKKEKALNMDRLFRETKVKLNQSVQNSDPNPEEETTSEVPLRTDEHGRPVRGWPNFQEVFMISALEGDGIADVKNYFKDSAQPSPWAFGNEILTDCPPADLCIKICKAKMLEYLRDEIPFIIQPRLEFWDTNDQGVLRIVIGMDTPNERIHKMVIGHGGSAINAIKSETEKNLSHLLQIPVDLFIHVAVKPAKKPKY